MLHFGDTEKALRTNACFKPAYGKRWGFTGVTANHQMSVWHQEKLQPEEVVLAKP